MLLNENIVHIDKPDRICSPTFLMDELQDHFYVHQSFLLTIQD